MDLKNGWAIKLDQTRNWESQCPTGLPVASPLVKYFLNANFVTIFKKKSRNALWDKSCFLFRNRVLCFIGRSLTNVTHSYFSMNRSITGMNRTIIGTKGATITDLRQYNCPIAKLQKMENLSASSKQKTVMFCI